MDHRLNGRKIHSCLKAIQQLIEAPTNKIKRTLRVQKFYMSVINLAAVTLLW